MAMSLFDDAKRIAMSDFEKKVCAIIDNCPEETRQEIKSILMRADEEANAECVSVLPINYGQEMLMRFPTDEGILVARVSLDTAKLLSRKLSDELAALDNGYQDSYYHKNAAKGDGDPMCGKTHGVLYLDDKGLRYQ